MQNIDYNMHIAKRNLAKDKEYADKIGGCIITNSAIESVPCARITQNNSLNLLIRRHHQNILELSRSRKDGHKYDEVGYLLEIIEPYNSSEPIYGFYNANKKISTIRATYNANYLNFITSHSKEQLIFMHNHPNNSPLSFDDIINLIKRRQLFAVTAIGNTGSIHMAYKSANYNEVEMTLRLFNLTNNINDKDEKYKNIAQMNFLKSLINNQDFYGIYFKYSKRRN